MDTVLTVAFWAINGVLVGGACLALFGVPGWMCGDR